MPHPPVRQLLLELVARILDALAGSLEVVYRNTGVPEPAVGIAVAVVDFVLRVRLGAVVVRQLDESLAVPDLVAVGGGLRAIVA